MPRMDGTGPDGKGSMTGRGKGRCDPSRPAKGGYGLNQSSRSPISRFDGAGWWRRLPYHLARPGGTGAFGGRDRDGGRRRGRGR